MELHGYQDPIQCRAFAIIIKGPALTWFNRLLPFSISSFTKLSIAFVSHFIRARTYRKPSYHLLTIKQSSQESLRSYVQRFSAESLKVDIPDEKFAITTFIAGLGVHSKDLMFSISKNPHASMVEVRLSHGYQISNCKWSRNGMRKPTHSQGMLLSINETKHGRQHLHGRARYAR